MRVLLCEAYARSRYVNAAQISIHEPVPLAFPSDVEILIVVGRSQFVEQERMLAMYSSVLEGLDYDSKASRREVDDASSKSQLCVRASDCKWELLSCVRPLGSSGQATCTEEVRLVGSQCFDD
jgi:hypothetical protein